MDKNFFLMKRTYSGVNRMMFSVFLLFVTNFLFSQQEDSAMVSSEVPTQKNEQLITIFGNVHIFEKGVSKIEDLKIKETLTVVQKTKSKRKNKENKIFLAKKEPQKRISTKENKFALHKNKTDFSGVLKFSANKSSLCFQIDFKIQAVLASNSLKNLSLVDADFFVEPFRNTNHQYQLTVNGYFSTRPPPSFWG